MFYGATDALLDASMAATAYEKAVGSDPAINLLICYGFLQALYIQQDAVWTLCRSLELKWHPNEDDRIKEIRDLRNRLTGHPALAGEKGKPRGLSSAIIEYHDVRKDGFGAHIYFEKGSERVTLHVPTVLKENEDRLVLQMLAVEAEMDNRERQFRAEQANKPLSNHFGTGFDYLLQRLRPEMDDEGRVIQAVTHAKMIRQKVTSLREDLNNRNLASVPISYHISVVLDGLDLIEGMIGDHDLSSKGQNQIDIACDGFVVNMNELTKHIDALDRKLNSPV